MPSSASVVLHYVSHTKTLLCLSSKVGLLQVRITRQDERLDLRQTIECVLRETKVILDDLLGCQTQPLSNTDIVVDRCLQDLEVDQVFRTGIFEIMGCDDGHVADVAGLEVEGARGCGGLEDGQTSLAADDEVPKMIC